MTNNIPSQAELNLLHFIHKYLMCNIDNYKVFCIIIDLNSVWLYGPP